MYLGILFYPNFKNIWKYSIQFNVRFYMKIMENRNKSLIYITLN